MQCKPTRRLSDAPLFCPTSEFTLDLFNVSSASNCNRFRPAVISSRLIGHECIVYPLTVRLTQVFHAAHPAGFRQCRLVDDRVTFGRCLNLLIAALPPFTGVPYNA